VIAWGERSAQYLKGSPDWDSVAFNHEAFKLLGLCPLLWGIEGPVYLGVKQVLDLVILFAEYRLIRAAILYTILSGFEVWLISCIMPTMAPLRMNTRIMPTGELGSAREVQDLMTLK